MFYTYLRPIDHWLLFFKFLRDRLFDIESYYCYEDYNHRYTWVLTFSIANQKTFTDSDGVVRMIVFQHDDVYCNVCHDDRAFSVKRSCGWSRSGHLSLHLCMSIETNLSQIKRREITTTCLKYTILSEYCWKQFYGKFSRLKNRETEMLEELCMVHISQRHYQKNNGRHARKPDEISPVYLPKIMWCNFSNYTIEIHPYANCRDDIFLRFRLKEEGQLFICNVNQICK